MNLRVRLFARARDLAGADHVAVELPAGATVADLRARLVAQYPRLAELAKRSPWPWTPSSPATMSW